MQESSGDTGKGTPIFLSSSAHVDDHRDALLNLEIMDLKGASTINHMVNKLLSECIRNLLMASSWSVQTDMTPKVSVYPLLGLSAIWPPYFWSMWLYTVLKDNAGKHKKLYRNRFYTIVNIKREFHTIVYYQYIPNFSTRSKKEQELWQTLLW